MADGDTDPALQSSIDETGPAAPSPASGKGGKGRGKAAEPETVQADPTQPRAVDTASGLLLDEHGLPISGPARRRWLEDAGIEIDPALKAQDEAENADG